MKNFLQCSVCANFDNNKIITVKEMMFGFLDEFEYLDCYNCGLVEIKSIPDNINKFYPDYYYSLNGEPTHYNVNYFAKLFKKKRDLFSIFRKDFLGRIFYFFYPNHTLDCLVPINISTDSKIIDIGCGSGTFLFTLKEIGFKNLHGIDPYLKRNIIYNNGLEIWNQDLFKVEGKWDLIMLHHSFEHMTEQLLILKKIYSLLSDDGVCLIRTPISSSYAYEHFGSSWVQMDAPRHFSIHSVTSFSMLADLAKLKVKNIVYDSDELQLLGSEQYVRSIPLRSKNSYIVDLKNSIFNRSDIREAKRKAKNLNKNKRGDQAAFYLQKNG